jgi:hypothetical protein
MPCIPASKEVESTVYRPGRWLVFLVGTVFVLAGGLGFLTIGHSIPPGTELWVAKSLTGVFALLGGVVLAWAVGSICSPIRIHHAAPDVLPDVPKEPVVCEGSVVHGRLTHELCETSQGWEFRPAGNGWRNDKRFLLGFGIPFLILFSGALTWVLHSQLNVANWLLAAVCGTVATAVCGGSAFLLIGLLIRSGYRRLSRLTIPRNGNDLEVESAEAPSLEKADLAEGLKWLFIGETRRQRLTIPRELIVAVQLCPWKFVMASSGGRESTWAVQGLMVLASSDRAVYHRLPVLLTGDFVGAARLMRILADTLQVPYLFCADAAGWKAEEIRAKNRPPLRIGGLQT